MSDPELLRLATWQLALQDGAPGELLKLEAIASWLALPKRGAVVVTTETDLAALQELVDRVKSHARKKAVVAVLGGGLDLREALGRLDLEADGFSLGDTAKLTLVHIDHWGGQWPTALPELRLDLHQPPPDIAAYRAAASAAVERSRAFVNWQERVLSTRPIGTWALCAVIVAMFGLELAAGGTDSLPVLVRAGALSADVLREGEIWRLATAAFLHGGFAHVGFALVVLWQLGGFLERVVGTSRFLVLYFLSALGGAFFALPTALFGTVVVGSSTALWGILVAHFVLSRRPRGLLPDALLPEARRIAGFNLLLNFAVSFLPGVSLMGHLGGGVVGAVLFGTGLATWGLSPQGEDERAGAVYRVFAAGLAGVFAACLTIGLSSGHVWTLANPEVEPTAIADGLVVPVPTQLEWRGDDLGRLPRDPVQLHIVEHRPNDLAAFQRTWTRLHPEDEILLVDGQVVTVRIEPLDPLPEGWAEWLVDFEQALEPHAQAPYSEESQEPEFEAEQGDAPQ